ncbi:MAG: YbaB/EbfC family nucleoid-associated protein [Firmicutes bacterium]|nr:YbaB/EbfC family nucleoid-associated protein [Bacillota bacterium]
MGGFKFPGGGGGMGNMQQMLRQAQKMQEDMQKAQEELEELEVMGTSGGGMVSVVLNGKKEFVSIKIKPEAVDPSDVEMLEDLVAAAFNDAASKADEEYEDRMGQFGGMF